MKEITIRAKQQNRTYFVEIGCDASVYECKVKLLKMMPTTTGTIQLQYKNQILQHHSILSQMGIIDDAVIEIITVG
jgi:hypothetical protein